MSPSDPEEEFPPHCCRQNNSRWCHCIHKKRERGNPPPSHLFAFDNQRCRIIAKSLESACLIVLFCTSSRIRNQLLQALADIKSEALEEIKNKTLSEISEKLLNLRFRNFTNLNGENVYIGKQREEKRRLPHFYRKCKKEMPETVEGIEQARPRRRREKKAKDGQKEAKEKIRKKLRLHNDAKRKKSNGKREQKIVVTLQYIISAVE